MPRQYQEQVSSRAIYQTQGQRAPEQAQVYAHPVDALVARSPSQYDLTGLVDGLKSFNPALEKYVNNANQTEAEKGAVDRLGGKEKPANEWSPYAKGYLEMDGQVKGQQDASNLIASYSTEFNKDQPPEALDLYLKGKYADMTKGLQDGPFLTGYEASIAPTLQKLRQDHLQYHQQKVVDTVESNAMKLLDSGIRGYTAQGQEVPQEYIENLRNTLGNTMGVNQGRFDQLLFEVVNRAANDGHMAAFDLLRRPHADGSPGMYYNPQWKSKIDNAELEAAVRSDRIARMAREDRQDQALMDVFLEADKAKATALFDQHVKAGLFTRASDLIKWRKNLEEHVDGKPNVDQSDAEVKLLTRIYKGGVKPQEIINADITNSQRRSLLSELRRVHTEERTLANQAAGQEKAIFKTPEYTSGEKYISMALSSSASPMDVMGVGNEFERQQKATGLLEFTRRAQGVKNPVELNAIREEIVDRHLKMRKNMSMSDKALPSAGLIRYPSPKEAKAAYLAGYMSYDELMLHDQYFTAQRNPKPNGR